jgi:CRISPR/Cas system-associated protein Cas10 (large subunit of type III CRISPR-Cas system)
MSATTRQGRIDRRECIDCGDPAERGLRCTFCANLNNERTKEKKRQRILVAGSLCNVIAVVFENPDGAYAMWKP